MTAGVALAITACWLLVLALLGATDVLLFLAPALLIVCPLIAGRYPGEDLIAALAARGGGNRRRPPAALVPAVRPVAARLSRGADLIAFSLAKRPPPATLPTQI